MAQVIPPPPFLTASSDGNIDFQPLNRWLLEIQSILSSAGTTFVDGTTAVTQPPGDNSTLIATDAFVLANSGGVPSTSNPLMDGVASPGVSIKYSRGDHVHPTDTSRAPLASPAFTGTPTAPTTAALTNNTQLATTAYTDSAVAVETTRAEAAEALLAPIASPAFTGTPTAPTPITADNSTKLATTAYVQNVVVSFAPLASPAFTGTPTAPTPATSDNSTKLATTAYVQNVVVSYAPLASPALTGTPTAPTAAPGTNTTQLATTAFVATSFAPLASPALTGTPTAPTQATGTNNTDIATTAFVQAAIAGATANVMPGFKFGFFKSAAGSSTSMTIGPGAAVDNGSTSLLIQTATFTKTTAAWASGSGNGGLGTGTIAASTWYWVFVIKNPTSGLVDYWFVKAVAATTPAAGTLPSGYTLARYIGSALTDASSNWVKFTEYNNKNYWGTSVLDVNNASPTNNTDFTVTISVPLGIRVIPMLRASVQSTTNAADVAIRSPDLMSAEANPNVDGSASATTGVTGGGLTLTRSGNDMGLPVYTNTSGQIVYRPGFPSGSGAGVQIRTYGWEDPCIADVVV